MNEIKLDETYKNFFKDRLVRSTSLVVIFISIIISIYYHFIFGIIVLQSFIAGCVLPVILIKHRSLVSRCLNKLKDFFGFSSTIDMSKRRCEICDSKHCQRDHASSTSSSNFVSRTPWKDLMVNENLDKAVESFYTKILNSFVESWFSLLSHNDDFVETLKQGLRQATCHIIVKLKMLDPAQLLTYKLLPILFNHIEIVQQMLKSGMSMDKLPNGFLQSEHSIHPAVINRRAEIDYLRAIAKCLIPRIFHSENFDSKIFFSLVRELIACWVLLPLMDVISDPNLINLMIIHATDGLTMNNHEINRKNYSKQKLKYESIDTQRKVEFLKNFVSTHSDKIIRRDENILNERNQLYVFMQYLKKEGAVDELRFYLDVDSLNKELQDPKVTTDPAKLSSLHQQSEKLLQDYNKLVISNELLNNYPEVQSLTEAHENVKANLEGKWRKAFTKTPDYFKLVYGSRDVKLLDDIKNSDQSGTVSRLGTKLKDAIRGAIDGAPLDATEVPTVWDALAENQVSNTNATIYSSVTSKLKKERGQNLDSFLMTFMQSIEQNPDIGEEVIEMTDQKFKPRPTQPGRNLVFGNLFGLNASPKHIQTPSSILLNIKGSSQCLLYILHKLFSIPRIIVNLVFAFVCISQSAMDSLVCYIINKLIKYGLYEPRLAILIRMLEEHIFETTSTKVPPSELLERQRQAKKRIEKLRIGAEYLVDVLQSPALNKHLMYCMFDVILAEIYPEFDN